MTQALRLPSVGPVQLRWRVVAGAAVQAEVADEHVMGVEAVSLVPGDGEGAHRRSALWRRAGDPGGADSAGAPTPKRKRQRTSRGWRAMDVHAEVADARMMGVEVVSLVPGDGDGVQRRPPLRRRVGDHGGADSAGAPNAEHQGQRTSRGWRAVDVDVHADVADARMVVSLVLGDGDGVQRRPPLRRRVGDHGGADGAGAPDAKRQHLPPGWPTAAGAAERAGARMRGVEVDSRGYL